MQYHTRDVHSENTGTVVNLRTNYEKFIRYDIALFETRYNLQPIYCQQKQEGKHKLQIMSLMRIGVDRMLAAAIFVQFCCSPGCP